VIPCNPAWINPQVARPERTLSRLISDDGDVDSTRALVMGILNVTPDSFFDGGRNDCRDDALRHAERMVGEGADIIDIGGESTRPGAIGVPLQQELDRVMPVIELLRSRLDVLLSIDTVKAEVMREAVSSGAGFINDVNALRSAGAMEIAVESGVPVCLMHMQGTPRDMQDNPEYNDVVDEVGIFLKERVNACLDAGMNAENIVVDPGFGFGKRVSHNLELLNGLDRLRDLGYVILAGLSRKSMIRKIVPDPVAGLYASVAMTVMAYLGGARILRVHDVAPTVEALTVARAVIRSDR
jgi:dihydropteroate synthase